MQGSLAWVCGLANLGVVGGSGEGPANAILEVPHSIGFRSRLPLTHPGARLHANKKGDPEIPRLRLGERGRRLDEEISGNEHKAL